MLIDLRNEPFNTRAFLVSRAPWAVLCIKSIYLDNSSNQFSHEAIASGVRINSYRPELDTRRQPEAIGTSRRKSSGSGRSPAPSRESPSAYPTPKTALLAPRNEPSDIPALIQELTCFGNAINENTQVATKQSLVDDELTTHDLLSKRFVNHRNAFQSVSDHIDFKTNNIAERAHRLSDQKAKTSHSQVDFARLLANRLLSLTVAGGTGGLIEDSFVTKDEFQNLKRQLRDEKRAIREIEDRVSSLNRNLIRKEDLDRHEFVSKPQLLDTIKDQNVAIENKVAALVVDLSKQSSTQPQLAELSSAVSDIREKMALNTSLEERTVELTCQRARADQLEARLGNQSSSLEHMRHDLGQQRDSVSELRTTIIGDGGDERGLTNSVQDNVEKVAILENSILTVNGELERMQAKESSRFQPVSSPSPTNHDDLSDRRINDNMDKTIDLLRSDQLETFKTVLDELERLEKCVKQQQHTLTEVTATQSQQSQSVVPRQPPTPPTPNYEVILKGKMEEYDRRFVRLEGHLRSLEMFVRTQQQKFDSLTTTQLAQSMINHMAQVYAYHPSNILGQIQDLRTSQTHADALIKQQALKLNLIDPQAIANCILGFQTVRKQTEDAVTKTDQYSKAVDDMRTKFMNLTRIMNLEINDLKSVRNKSSEQQATDIKCLHNTLISLEQTMEQASTSLRDQTNTVKAELNSLQNQVKTFVDATTESKHSPASTREDSAVIQDSAVIKTTATAVQWSDTEEDRPLREVSRFSNTSSSTTAVSSKKRTPDICQSSDDDDPIRPPGKRTRRPGDAVRCSVSKGGY